MVHPQREEDGWVFSCFPAERPAPRVAQKFAVVISGTRPVENNVRAAVALALDRPGRASIRDRRCAGIPIPCAEDTTPGGFVADAGGGGSVIKAVIVALFVFTFFTFFNAVNVV